MNHIIKQTWKRLAAVTVCLIACRGVALSQTPVILEIEADNCVQYLQDVSDWSKFASDSAMTTISGAKSFQSIVNLGDIVAVNGRPAKGTLVSRIQVIFLTTTAAPGQAISDVVRGGVSNSSFEILQPDGTPVGTIMAQTILQGAAPPGSPAALTSQNGVIVGGTGSFLGVRGQAGLGAIIKAPRNASFTEDPANRRIYGGGKMRFVMQMIPMFRPEIASTSGGPAIVHSKDFSLVTTANPAKPGEVLSLFANGLGSTAPSVEPGKPFPSAPLALVNSPVELTVNSAPVEVIGSAGLPGSVDAYQVNFRVPPGTASGTASVQLNVAWIPSSTVSIAIQ